MGHRTFMYHPTVGAKIFDSDNLPSETDGWVDDPKKLANTNNLPSRTRVESKPKSKSQAKQVAAQKRKKD